jgi:Sulfatase
MRDTSSMRMIGVISAILVALSIPVLAQDAPDRTVLPLPAPAFKGVIGKTYEESNEAWPELPTPPAGAPNVVLILLDDVSFGQTSTFGGPILTSELDKIAAHGIHYNRFHTTAVCSPTRVKEGKLVYEYNWFDDWFDDARYKVSSSGPLPTGSSTVKMEFAYDGGGVGKGGTATLYVDGKKVGEGRIEKTVAGRFGINTFGVGEEDTDSPVSNAYKPPFAFNGRIERGDVELK